jgi:DNA-binding NtrC family response regulator
MNERERILVVDDEKDFARGLSRLLGGEFPEVDVLQAGGGDEALDLLAEKNVQVMLTDLRMPAMNGLALLRAALKRHPSLTVIILTAFGTIETAVEALKAGAYDFLTKPVETEQLFGVVGRALERGRLLGENRRLKELLSGKGPVLVGETPGMVHLRRSIETVARSDYPVLILGESGTGKELTARMIHALSGREGRPFQAVNCPAIPEGLLESELFGHVRGAFTGADRDREGLFASASGGTLLLDEIGDLPKAMQVKLLRVLEEGEVRPVGGSGAVPVDVRVLASTNRDLEERIRDGSFREDLYYRLNVLTVAIPPLRDRVEDIPLLAAYFLRQSCREMGLPPKSADPEVLAWLSQRPWPGNVRELQNVMRRLTVFCSGERLGMEVLRLAGDGPGGREAEPEGAMPYKEAKAAVVDSFTRRYVQSLLRETGGNISEAARRSGLSRMALQKILSRLDMNAARFR